MLSGSSRFTGRIAREPENLAHFPVLLFLFSVLSVHRYID